MPILEEGQGGTSRDGILPRILRQVAGSARAERNLLRLGLLFAAVSVLELALLLRLPCREALVVYVDVPRRPLVELCP
jgi:hypothetical protein